MSEQRHGINADDHPKEELDPKVHPPDGDVSEGEVVEGDVLQDGDVQEDDLPGDVA